MERTPATLTGLAIGDALGMPFETHPFSSTALHAWDGSFQSGASNTLQPDMAPGQWTDDTKMALGLAESLIEANTYSPVAAAAQYVGWFFSGDHRGMGKATRLALERLIRGHHWLDSGIQGAQGNGTAMRAAPLGLFYHRNPLAAAKAAVIDARITHASKEAEDGSAIVAAAVAILMREDFNPKNLIQSTLYYTGFESEVASKLCDVRDFFEDRKFDKVEERLKAAFTLMLQMGTGAHVVQTVPAAFLCFLSTSSFKDAVELAIRAGGDTDTTAAITGALAGTFYGVEATSPYLDQLEDSHKLTHIDNLLYLTAPLFPEDP